ncbi:MAG: right-handed parallel beta-helix repeat-containing protein [Phycisphaerae bacterium]|nr:right-handed parallel beta-helix repeat-containing protein [Phycisphaerae bacterium]
MTPGTTIAAGRSGQLTARLPLAALTIFLLLAPLASAAEYFVKPDGHDETGGTSPDSALRTIQKGADRLAPGDTLTLAPGEYLQRFTMRRSGTAEKPITIRAAIPQFSVIRGNEIVRGFRKVEGMRFIWSIPRSRPVYRVLERDTQTAYLEAPALVDMDQFRRSHLYDPRAKILYIHTSDGQPPDQHVIAATVIPAYGVEITGEYVHVDGLVIEGFFPTQMRDSGRGFGMSVTGQQHEIRRCGFLFNGGGITINARKCVIRDNLLIGNLNPGYGELAQIYCTGQSEGVRILNNTLLNAQMYGIRNYGQPSDGEVAGNIVKDHAIGIDFKASKGKRSAVRNVSVGCSHFSWYSGAFGNDLREDHNTLQAPGFWAQGPQPWMGKHTLFFGPDQGDPRFAAPDHLDYRLQADSPFRGRGPDGADLGAHPFEPSVFFVGPTGNDSNSGLSVNQAFKTAGRAMRECRPGVTVYLLEGEYREPVRPETSGTAERPVMIRGRTLGPNVSVNRLDLSGLQHVWVDNLGIKEGAVLRDTTNIRLDRCRLLTAAGDALTVENGADIWLRRLSVSSTTGSAIRLRGVSKDVRITSSILHAAAGRSLDTSIDHTRGLFCEYNDYSCPPPLAIVNGRPAQDLTALQRLTGGDRYSLAAEPRWSDPDSLASIEPDSPCVAAGELCYNIGAGQTASKPIEPQIAEIQLRDVTPTTASLTWWTPYTSNATWRTPLDWSADHPVHSEIHYGTNSTANGRQYSFGDLYHQVTLHDLRPGTLYQFKIVIPDRPWRDSIRQPYAAAAPRTGWRGAESQTLAFKTPTVAEWKPTRRTFYVAPTGSEANPGLDERAPTTLTAVSDRVRAGDTAVLLDGIYHEMFAPAATGTQDAPITLKARSPGRACLDGSTFLRPAAIALFWKDQIVIDGLVIRRFADKAYGDRAGLCSSQVFLARCGEVTIQNCVLAGWGIGYGHGIVARGGDHITIQNCVITGFAHAANARQTRAFTLTGNTWYVPLIDCFNLDGRVVVKNNLFFGQEPQKVVNFIPMVCTKRPTESDYNTFYFGPGNEARYIGYGLNRRRERDMGGVRRIQQELGLEQHSLEATTQDVQLSGPVPTEYMNPALLNAFGNRIRSGELIPTIEMFQLPARSRLRTAGENGRPIGAQPPAR